MEGRFVRILAGSLLAGSLLAAPGARAEEDLEPVLEARPLVEVALCLDTSDSMRELLDSARLRLWEVVNAVGSARPTPELRVALITFGSPDAPGADAHQVVRRLDFTHDLDDVQEALFALRTDGGTELVGRALDRATRELTWTRGDQVARIIAVAGNESADQQPQHGDFREATALARDHGMRVHALFAGTDDQGRRHAWADVARRGGGVYAAIDTERGSVAVRTPYDDALAALDDELDATWLPYGWYGGEKMRKIAAQDALSASVGTLGTRAITKGSMVYEKGSWDLVEAVERDGLDLDTLPVDSLPLEMRAMTRDERSAHVERTGTRRREVLRRIEEVRAERQSWLAGAAEGGQATLDEVLIAAIREHLAEKGLSVP